LGSIAICPFRISYRGFEAVLAAGNWLIGLHQIRDKAAGIQKQHVIG
jgi:hypothetical protein